MADLLVTKMWNAVIAEYNGSLLAPEGCSVVVKTVHKAHACRLKTYGTGTRFLGRYTIQIESDFLWYRYPSLKDI